MNSSRKLTSKTVDPAPLKLVHSVNRSTKNAATLNDRQTRWSLVAASAILSLGFLATAPGFLDLGAFYSGTVHFALWATLVLAWSAFHNLYKGEVKLGFKSTYVTPFYIAVGLTCFLFFSVGTGNRLGAESVYWTDVSQSLHQNYSMGNARGPALYPFLASLLHSLFGFKDQHMFWINFVACAFLFTLMIRVGERITKSRWYGIVSVFFLASFPMFGVMATGNGPELWNTLLVAAVCYQIYRFVQDPTLVRAELTVALTLLAAQCQPASLFFLVPFGSLVYQNRTRLLAERPDLKTVLLPLLTIPVAALILANGWLSSSMNGTYFMENVRGVGDFLLNRGSNFPISSQLFTLCAMAGLALLASNWQRIVKTHHASVRAAGFYFGGLTLVMLASFAYEMRDLSRLSDARFLLVYLPVLALCATYPLYRMNEKGVGASVIGLLVVANFCYQLPNQTRTLALNLETKSQTVARRPASTPVAPPVGNSRVARGRTNYGPFR